MMLSIVPPQFFLPKDSVKLGRFITAIDNPTQNFHDPACTKEAQVSTSLRASFSGMSERDTASRFGSKLTSLMSMAFSKRAKAKFYVASDQIKTYILDNSDDWFQDATEIPATQSWIERQVDRRYIIYLIVGFHTMTDARITQEAAAGKTTEGQINVPVSIGLAAAGAIIPFGNLIDPSVGGHHHNLNGSKARFLAPGEQVCAFQYRRVCHRWLSSKPVDQSRLSRKPWWSSVEAWREQKAGDEDIIEVELADVQGLEGDWDREESGDGETLLVPSFKEI